jgi:hypothetical protein
MPPFRITQAQVVGRIHIPDLLNAQGLLDAAVEVGTHRGEYARTFLDRWRGRKLFCIDPWLRGYCDGDPASEGDRHADYHAAFTALTPHLDAGRCTIFQETSEEAQRRFEPGSVDFVYIDGNHQYEHVLADLMFWWPIVRPGGYLGGHDIICPNELNGGWEQTVQPAVFKFLEGVKQTLELVVDNEATWSYLIRKG